MVINWEAMTAVVVVIGFVSGGFALYVKSTIRAELSAFKNELVRELDDTYIRRSECDLHINEISRRLDSMESGS